MSSSFLRGRYRTKLDIDVIIPNAEQQDMVDRVIFEELAYSVFSKTSRQAYLKNVDDLSSSGAEGLVLGCTDIPLLIHQEDWPSLQMFDTLRLHVEAAVEMPLRRRTNLRCCILFGVRISRYLRPASFACRSLMPTILGMEYLAPQDKALG
jgi:hypothetical protein